MHAVERQEAALCRGDSIKRSRLPLADTGQDLRQLGDLSPVAGPLLQQVRLGLRQGSGRCTDGPAKLGMRASETLELCSTYCVLP